METTSSNDTMSVTAAKVGAGDIPASRSAHDEQAGAYGYVDADGRIRAISASRADAVRNARLNGFRNIVALRTTASGTVACTGPSPVIRWEDI